MKQTFIEKAKITHRLHAGNLKKDPHWRVQDTAELLDRSIGAVSQDLLIASWCKTHQIELEKFKTMKEALEFIRGNKFFMKMDGVDD